MLVSRYDLNVSRATEAPPTDFTHFYIIHLLPRSFSKALGHAVSQGAGFVIVPCCFRSNPHLRVSIPKGDNNGSREVELVTAEEFLGVDPDQYTPLKQLAELQGDIKLASKAMHTINALRALAVDRLWKKKTSTRVSIHTSIKTFPIGFSTRNFCLVGQYDKPHLPNK